MSHRSSPRTLVLTGMLALALAGTGAISAGASNPQSNRPTTDAGSTAPGQDRTSVIVQLRSDPLATSTDVERDGKGKLDLQGKGARAERAELAAERNAFKSWLRANAPKATITSTFDVSLNAVAVRLNGTSIDTLRAAPGVRAVEYQGVYTPLAHEDPDLALIDGLKGWAAAGAATDGDAPSTWAGYGVKVGIVDSGVDASHPCFDDTGYDDVAESGPKGMTNDKVVVAKVFNEQAKRLGDTVADKNGHGTHVAGTVACNLHTAAVVDGAEIPYAPSGVAPGALIGNYNVFPGPDSSARTEDIVNALDAAAADGMDVINMSLGGGYSGAQDLGTRAVDNLDRAGIVVAVAAGNDGPAFGTTGSPGSAERALSAGASSVGHYVGVPISSGSGQVSVGAIGDFEVPQTDLTGELALLLAADGALSQACGPVSGSLEGQIALVSRGTCTFGTKIYHAEQAGAEGVIVVNNAPGDPSAMGLDAAFTTTIPAVMAPFDDKVALMALGGESVTMGADRAYARTGNDNILMGFSSWGPTRVNYLVKPDVVAPGGNVLSAQPGDFCDDESCWAFYSGTSMATPHLAGMAAVVIDAHPEWSASNVRSAIANTADIDGVFQTVDITTPELDVQKVGNGLANLEAAVGADVVFDRTTLSFGAVASGSGKAQSATFALTNVSGAPISVPVSVRGATGPITVSADEVELEAGESTTLTVTFSPVKGQTPGPVQGHVHVGDSHLAVYAFVK